MLCVCGVDVSTFFVCLLMHASVHKKSYVVQCTRWVLSVHGRLLWANKHHPRRKAFSYNSFESFNDISCIFEHWKATVALWKIMTTMREKYEMKNKVQKTRKVNSIQLESDDGSNSSATCIYCHFFCTLQLLLSDIVQISLHTNRFFALLHYFFSVQLRRVESNLFSFHITSCILCTFMQVQRAFPLSKLLIEFHSKCCCCAALYFRCVVIVAAMNVM